MYGVRWHTSSLLQEIPQDKIQWTEHGVLFKILGALPKDTYRYICNYFGILPIEERISARQGKFTSRYCAYRKVTYAERLLIEGRCDIISYDCLAAVLRGIPFIVSLCCLYNCIIIVKLVNLIFFCFPFLYYRILCLVNRDFQNQLILLLMVCSVGYNVRRKARGCSSTQTPLR